MSYHDKKEKCTQCGKTFIVRTTVFPCYMENKVWDTYYTCPYCGDVTKVRISGRESIETFKLEE